MINNNCQPPSASGSPRFCNMGNFMRLPHVTSAEGLDFAIVGIPFDTAASFRAGARFGPNGVRNISAMIKPNNVAMGVNIMDSLKGADLGLCLLSVRTESRWPSGETWTVFLNAVQFR
jgi:arginase family enzyme